MANGNAGSGRSYFARRLAWSVCAVSLVCISCGGCSSAGENEGATSTATAPQRGSTRVASTLPLTTDAYFAEATSIDLFEIRSSEIALKRSTGNGRSFALQALQHHQALSAQLAFAGRYLNMLPSRVLLPEHQQMLDLLLATNDFDRLYLAQQRLVCGRALQLHGRFAQRGSSPTLRPVAQFGVSIATSDLQLLGR